MIETIKITDAGVIEQIREKMPLSTIAKNGLMPAGLIGSKNVMSSVLLCETTAPSVTASILLAVSATTSGMPNLYFISMARATGSKNDPAVKVKVLSGTYNIKIIGKTDAEGKCKIYAERTQFTPVLNILSMNTVGIAIKMETVTDNSEFANGFEAELR